MPWGSREGPVGLRAVGHTVGGPMAGRSVEVPQVQCRLCGSVHIPRGLVELPEGRCVPRGVSLYPLEVPLCPTDLRVSP